ncbi:MAG: VacJ family lipoprotein [Methylacidiphilales bacterium]|nr:VacJ family lipoprotein [Candidatus Methylacidiphilales bacterium]
MSNLFFFLILCTLLTSGCSIQQSEIKDPYFNKNQQLYEQFVNTDESVWKPSSEFYSKTFDSSVHTTVNNFFTNLAQIKYGFNNFLQGKFIVATEQLARFVVNTIFGLFGIFDVASSIDLKSQPQDFGQTLALWGYRKTNFLIVPILGPTTERDALGYLFDFFFLSPLSYSNAAFATKSALTFIDIVDTRRTNSDAIDFIYSSGIGEDSYSFFKSVWSRNRNTKINELISAAGIKINSQDDLYELLEQ